MTTATKPKSKSAKKQSSSAGIWIVVGAVVLLALVVLLLWLNNRPTVTTITAPDVPAEWVSGASLGKPDAPVTIQMWEDFLCPACQQFATTIKPQLMADYVKTGIVRLEFHQFPLQQHAPGAIMAANATLCAADQNQFWPYHDRVFQEAAARGQAGATPEQLLAMASEVGLDGTAMSNCLNNLQFNNDVAASLTQAQQLGLNSTPSILVNGTLVENPFNYNALRAQIDAAAGSN